MTLTQNQTRTPTVAARFFSNLAGTCAHALLRLVPDQAPKTGHQKRSQFRFEVPARIAFPGGRCRNGRCDCSPASRERFEGTLMSGPQYLAASVKERLAAECHSTSFKHALYWLMRNLFKIPRGAAGVNVRGFLAGVSTRKPSRTWVWVHFHLLTRAKAQFHP